MGQTFRANPSRSRRGRAGERTRTNRNPRDSADFRALSVRDGLAGPPAVQIRARQILGEVPIAVAAEVAVELASGVRGRRAGEAADSLAAVVAA